MATDMKVIIASDIHAHKYRSFNQDGRRLGNIINLIEELFGLADEHKADIWIPGDLFNTMQTIQTEAMVAVTHTFKKMGEQYPGVMVIIISGNHDYATRNTIETPAISAIQTLAMVSDNVVCIDNRSIGGGGDLVHGVPYYDNPEEFKVALGKVEIEEGAANYLLMHQQVGFDQDFAPDDIDPDDPLLEKFAMVFNGHIHTHSQLSPKFVNVGTPLHRDAGDIGKDKGVLLFDTETDTFEQIILNYPQYRRLDEGEEVPEGWEDDYIEWVPKQIEVELEEQEIQENFDHAKCSREEILDNYLQLKDSSPAIVKYGKELLSHAN